MKQRVTQQELDDAVEAVRNADGNQSAAARALGIPRETLRGRLRLAEDAGNEAEKSKEEIDKRLQRELDKSAEQLEHARNARGLFVPDKQKRRSRPKTFARLILADTHGSHAQPEAIRALLDDCESVDIREIVLLGDHLECGGFLAQHHTLGYVAQIDEEDPEEDIAATRDLLDALHTRCPRATIHYLEGNHEHRVERWCVQASGGSKSAAEYLLRCHSPETALSLADRGVAYYRQGEKHCGLDQRGTIKLGRCYFAHKGLTRKHAASGMVERFAACVFFGHTHRADYFPTRLVGTGLVAAWCPGCLCELQPRYQHSDPTSWTHGYILQLVNGETGEFHAIPVPIDKGHSFLANLLEAVG